MVRIQPTLQRDELRGAGIGPLELLESGVDLVRKVVGAIERQRSVDQLPGPHADLRAGRL